MKKVAIALLGTVFFIGCAKTNKIEITVANVADDTTVEILTKPLGSDLPLTTLEGVVKEGKVEFDNPFTDIDEAYLQLQDETKASAFFIGEPGNITLFIDVQNPDKPKTGGTPNNIKLQELQEALNPAVEELMSFINMNSQRMPALMQSTDEQSKAEFLDLQVKYQELSMAVDQATKDFIEANPNSVLELLLFNQKVLSQMQPIEEYQAEFDAMPSEIKSSLMGKKAQELINSFLDTQATSLEIGSVLPGFSAKDPKGNEVTLTDVLKGKKLVLVDVWAAWCGPCRMENPNLVTAYNKYKSKGFDIIGYSLDKEESAWLKAIEVDKLAWTQITNLAYFEDPIVAAYGIQGIPANYLVDQKGVILAKDLRGAELDKAIQEFLK